MSKQKDILILIFFLLAVCGFVLADSKTELRKDLIGFLRKAGLNKELDAGVTVSADAAGNLCILDEGKFFMQYLVMEPQVSADAGISIDPNVTIPSSCSKAVIVTHGWLDSGRSDWPSDIVQAIRKKVDPNEWVCGFFDWHGGALVISPIDAAKYGRDIGGYRLANALLKLGVDFEHFHLIGHSAGSWTINTAAKILAEKTKAQIHLTFLDAYVPPGWEEKEPGNIKGSSNVWVEHYYTRDFTLKTTHVNLSAAHNVDVTGIDPWINEHEFPYRWYYATIAGKYRDNDSESGEDVITGHGGIDYGFARSREAGNESWTESLELEKGNATVKLRGTKNNKWYNPEFFKKKKGK